MIDGFQMLPLTTLTAFINMVRSLELLVKVVDEPLVMLLSNKTKMKIDIFFKTRAKSYGIGSPDSPKCINEKNKDVIGLFEGRMPTMPLYEQTKQAQTRTSGRHRRRNNVQTQQQPTKTAPTPSRQQEITGRASTATPVATCLQSRQNTPPVNWQTQGKQTTTVSQTDRRDDAVQQTSTPTSPGQSDNGTVATTTMPQENSVIRRCVHQGSAHQEMHDGRQNVRMFSGDTADCA